MERGRKQRGWGDDDVDGEAGLGCSHTIKSDRHGM